jgi:hypothetical protein
MIASRQLSFNWITPMSPSFKLFALAVVVLPSCDVIDPDPRAALLTAHPGGRNFEVWLVDQSNSPGQPHGGTIHVFPRSGLVDGPVAATTVDLAGPTTALCLAATGAAPVRPHMLLFTARQTHAVLSFVASGHVVIFNAASREPVGCLRTSVGAGGARQAHAAFPAPDDSYLLVANQNGKLLERIDLDLATNTFALNPLATIDLAGCTTPSGAPCQDPILRPDNAPICPIIDATSREAFITLRGGGLFVVDPKATPMRITAEYDASVVHGNGCGGVQSGGSMYLDSGGGTGANQTEFDVYRFPLGRTGLAGGQTLTPNEPRPDLLYSDDTGHRDAHGMAVTTNNRFLWVADRAANLAEVFRLPSGERLAPVDLRGPLSSDPTPDLVDVSPNGDLMFITLRGPNPLSGDPHVATGTTPGLAVIRLDGGGRSGTMVRLLRISNLDPAGVERADPHGLRVRVLQ